MAEDSDLEKTEEPTYRRIEDAVKKGQVAFSREVTNFLVFAVIAINIVWMMPAYSGDALKLMARFLQSPEDIILDTGGFISLMRNLAASIGVIMLAPVALIVVAMLLSSLLQHGFIVSTESIMPKLEKISPLKGIKRLFSMRQFMEFLKGIIKITLVGLVVYLAVSSESDRLALLVNLSMAGIMQVLSQLAFKMVLAATSVMMIIALIDFIYQRFEYMKSLRMTKQEVKDEYKQSEGDPHIKAKLRQIRQERARRRMMAAVPSADVVIRNPEHYAVALKYDQATMPAPLVVAKGQDAVALKIIEIAGEHKVPTITNRPLARALYNACDIEETIPLEHYQAVAEVIAYVYKLRKGTDRKRA